MAITPIIPNMKDVHTCERMFQTAEPATMEAQMDLVERLKAIEEGAAAFTALMLRCCPPGRELAVSLTNFEQALLWAEAAITRGPA